MPFTDDELQFLAHHGYGPEDVYDGRFESKWSWQTGAKEQGKILVLGSACRAYGHRIRTRAGHCAQCDPKKIAYQRRFSEAGYVYIAGSLAGRVIKIGTASDMFQRWNQLRAERYGGFRDWNIIFSATVEEAGRIEFNARRRLSAYVVSRLYDKNGSIQTANELLRCSFTKALEALQSEMGESGRIAYRSPDCADYEFE